MTLFCNATGNPVPTISWTKNGSPVNITDNSRIRFLKDNKQLTIPNVNRRDSGEYQCVANNSVGNDTSNVAALIVQCKYIVLKIAFQTLCDFFVFAWHFCTFKGGDP